MRALLCFLPLLASPALAEDAARPPTGRYALHAEACRAKDYFLTIAAERMDLPVFSCTGMTYRQSARGPGDRAVWNVAARQCQGEEGAPGPQRFSLEARGTSLRIFWADGSKSAPLMRCGR